MDFKKSLISVDLSPLESLADYILEESHPKRMSRRSPSPSEERHRFSSSSHRNDWAEETTRSPRYEEKSYTRTVEAYPRHTYYSPSRRVSPSPARYYGSPPTNATQQVQSYTNSSGYAQGTTRVYEKASPYDPRREKVSPYDPRREKPPYDPRRPPPEFDYRDGYEKPRVSYPEVRVAPPFHERPVVRDQWGGGERFVDEKYAPRRSYSHSPKRRRRSYSRSSDGSYYSRGARKKKSRKERSSSSSSSDSSDSENEDERDRGSKTNKNESGGEPDRAAFLKKREDYLKKLVALEKEVSRLKQQEEDLKRGDKDANANFVMENIRLQTVLQGNVEAIRNVVEKINRTFGITEPLPTAEEEEKVQPKLIQVPSTMTPEPTEVQRFDNGQPWCEYCNKFPLTLKGLLKHCSSEEHKQNMKEKNINDAPWHSQIDPEKEKVAMTRVQMQPLTGYQFIVPAEGWYCQLCHEWMGDQHCAILHFYSDVHLTNYAAFTATHVSWEFEWQLKRQQALDNYDARPDDNITPELRQEWEELQERIKKRDKTSKPKEDPPPNDSLENRSIRVQMRNLTQMNSNNSIQKEESAEMQIDEWMQKDPPPCKWDTLELEKDDKVLKRNAFLAAGKSFKSAVEKQEEERLKLKKEKEEKERKEKMIKRMKEKSKKHTRSRSKEHRRSRRSRSGSYNRSRRSYSRGRRSHSRGRRSHSRSRRSPSRSRRSRSRSHSKSHRRTNNKEKYMKLLNRRRSSSSSSSSPEMPPKKKPAVPYSTTKKAEPRKDRPLPVIGKMPILRNKKTSVDSPKPPENNNTRPPVVTTTAVTASVTMPAPVNSQYPVFNYGVPPPPLILPRQIYQGVDVQNIPKPPTPIQEEDKNDYDELRMLGIDPGDTAALNFTK